MNTIPCINLRMLLFLATTLGLTFMAMAAHGFPPDRVHSQAAKHNDIVMHLGKIEVRGQKHVLKTLQAIKVGLRQPYSTSPRLANVVVCRLQDKAGSHIMQWLICGTNRILSANRDAMHTMMISAGSDTDANNSMGVSTVSPTFTETLNSQRGHYLKTLVNGPGLRSLLEKIPYPPAAR